MRRGLTQVIPRSGWGVLVVWAVALGACPSETPRTVAGFHWRSDVTAPQIVTYQGYGLLRRLPAHYRTQNCRVRSTAHQCGQIDMGSGVSIPMTCWDNDTYCDYTYDVTEQRIVATTQAAARILRERVRSVLQRYALENYAVLTESTVCIRPPAPTDVGYESYLANANALREIVVPLNVTGRGLLWDSIKQNLGPAVCPIFAFMGCVLLAYHHGNPAWKLYAFLIAGMLAISVGFTVAGYRLRVRQWGMLPARRTKPATATS